MSSIRITQTRRLLLINEMDRTCFPGEPFPAADFEKTVWFLCKVDGIPAAYAGIKIVDGVTGYLNRAGVLPQFAGQGLQKRLIKARERWAIKEGLRSLITYTCQTACRSPNSLISCGFKLYRPERAWAGRDWLYFRKLFT